MGTKGRELAILGRETASCDPFTSFWYERRLHIGAREKKEAGERGGARTAAMTRNVTADEHPRPRRDVPKKRRALSRCRS